MGIIASKIYKTCAFEQAKIDSNYILRSFDQNTIFNSSCQFAGGMIQLNRLQHGLDLFSNSYIYSKLMKIRIESTLSNYTQIISDSYVSCVCWGFMSKDCDGLEKIVLKGVYTLFKTRIVNCNTLDCNITVFNRFLLLFFGLVVLFTHLSFYIYILLSFITNYLLAFLIFKGFYFGFFSF